MGLAVGISLLPCHRADIICSYKYFLFGGRHLPFPTSGCMRWCHQLMHWNAGQWIYGVPRSCCNYDVIISAGRDINTSGLMAAILDLTLPVRLYNTTVNAFESPGPKNLSLQFEFRCYQVYIPR